MIQVSSRRVVLAEVPEVRLGVVRRTVKEMISDKLISLIASGVLQVGDELPSEREFASIFAVSRETVRGAIQTLAAKGIVEVSHGARTRVVTSDVGPFTIGISNPSAINRYDIDSVHGARILVERAVVAEAAERIDSGALLKLANSLAAQQEAIDDPVQFLICDREFHVTIYRCSANPLLSDFVIDLYNYMMEHRRTAVSQPGAIRRSYQDHLAIAAALRARDPVAVVRAFDRHIDRIYLTTRSILDEREQKGGPRRT
jgi:DNA-binding FadR family transcriptional regulator